MMHLLSSAVALYALLNSPLVAGMQFERTLIVAEDDAEVSYLEGCTAPSYDKNQVCCPSCQC
jgi:Fe-S cluster assembly scaffold protein SufB